MYYDTTNYNLFTLILLNCPIATETLFIRILIPVGTGLSARISMTLFLVSSLVFPHHSYSSSLRPGLDCCGSLSLGSPKCS